MLLSSEARAKKQIKADHDDGTDGKNQQSGTESSRVRPGQPADNRRTDHKTAKAAGDRESDGGRGAVLEKATHQSNGCRKHRRHGESGAEDDDSRHSSVG